MLYTDKLIFLDQVMPVHNLVYEKKIKAVWYGENGQTMVGALAFMIVLEDFTTDYATLEIQPEDISEARLIIESIKLIDN